MDKRNKCFAIYGGAKVHSKTGLCRVPKLIVLLAIGLLLSTSSAFAQGSIFGSVSNSDASTPANGDINFFGYLDDTDEEIRIETSTGAGYDAGNWFDDFQNYLTEAPNNPYDYHFYNSVNSEGFVLSKLIPNNSFQQEDVTLAAVAWPAAPAGLTGVTVSGTATVISWTGTAGLTYHVYRRSASSNGSFFRIDDPSGSLANPGVSDSFYVDNTVDGTSSYHYLIIAEDVSGNLSPHSAILTVNSAAVDAPVLASLDPNSGFSDGGTLVNVYGSGFDPAGAQVLLGAVPVDATVLSPFHLTITTPTAPDGAVDVAVTNTASGLSSNILTGGYTYVPNSTPVVADIPDQTIDEGATFAVINLDDYVTDPDNTDDEITWSYSGNTELTVDITSRVATITIPDVNWNGAETITFRATDPGALFAEDAATFTVNAVNDAPVVAGIPDQTIDEGATFTTITLDDYVSDVDNGDAELIWTYSGNTALTVAITDRVATITIPDVNWNGAETITFTATDPGTAFGEDAAVFTVNAINDAPVVADIPDQTIDEGATFTTINLDDFVSDVDDADDQIIWSYTGNTDLTVDITARVATITIPDIDWNGVETITFTATDPGALFAEDAATFTVNAVNDAPVVADIPDQAVAEGASFATINLDDYVADVDHADTEMTWTYSGNIELTVDITDRVATITTPSTEWNGSEVITFRATDPGTLFAEDAAAFTISADNDAPVVIDIPDQTIDEGSTFATITLDDYVSDVDNVDTEMTWTYSGNTALTVDITDRVATITIPDVDWNGTETITFRATDPGALFDEDAATFTVNAINDAPVVADIPDQTIDEGATFTSINLDDFVSDVDNADTEIIWTFAGNTELTVDITDRVATVTIPDIEWNGAETVTFTATDPGTLFAEDAAIFTVNAVNDVPVLAVIGPQVVTEGENLNFTTSATDIENDVLTMTADSLPANATYTDNGDGTAVFDFNANYDQAGLYNVYFIVSDGQASDTEIVAITVNEFGNNAPTLDSIRAQTIAENEVLNLTITGSDPDGTIPTLSATDVPLNAVFTDNLDGTASFVFSPDFTQEGIYPVTFKAFDGSLVDSEVVEITVVNTNQLPVLTTVGPQSIDEGDSLVFNVSATDGDGVVPTLTTSVLPGMAVFVDSTNGVGTFSWAPEYTEAGVYNVMFYASDGVDTDSSEVEITVNEMGNQPPEIDSIPPQDAEEGDSIAMTITATDPDGTIPTLTADSLPVNATFVDNGDGTGTLEFYPDFNQSGIYNIYIIADDGEFVDTTIVTFNIAEPGNQAPVLAGVVDTTINEGDSLVVVISATDPEGLDVFFSVSTSLPGYSFVDSGNGVAVFGFESDYYDAGARSVTFFATDNEIPPATGSATMTINIADVNQPPVIDSIGPYGVKIGDQLVFDVTASDDSDPIAANIIAMTAVGVPTNASYVDNGDNSGTFTFNPDSTQTGSFVVTFIATDQGAPQLSTNFNVTINVVMENRVPEVAYIGPQTINEGELLEFAVSATDPDGGIPALSLRGNPTIPEGATLVDNGDGTGLFSFTPSFVQAGLYGIDFRAFDGIDYGKETVVIQVYEAGNQAPIVTPVTPDPVDEGDTLAFVVSATDPDGSIPILTVDSLPENALFIDSANGSGLIVFLPLYYQSGTFNIYVMADDGEYVDTLIVTVTVNEVGNQKPEFGTVADQTVVENQLLTFDIIVTDPDRHINALSATGLPGTSTLTDNGDNTGTFNWTTTYDDFGDYTVTFYTDDPGGLADTITVQISVTNFNQRPRYNVSTLPTDVDMFEGDTLNIMVYGLDQDGPIPIIEFDTASYTLAENMTFVDSGNGAALFTFTPNYTQGSPSGTLYYLRWKIIDAEYDTAFIYTNPATQVEVFNANMPPEIMAVDDTTIIEGTPLTIGILVDDVDATAATLTTSALPSGASFTDNGNNFGLFNWTPSYLQAGVYQIDFIAIDGADVNVVDTETVVITVTEAGNQSPRLLTSLPDTIPAIVNEANVTFLSYWDPEEEAITISADFVPSNAIFTDSGNGNATYVYTPNFSDLDVTFGVTFIADDASGAADTALVYFHVIEFLRGDANSDSELDISDIMYIYNYLYKDGQAPLLEDAADVNVDSAINLLDGLYLLDYFFRQGPPPPND